MAVLSVNIPDAQVARVRAAYRVVYGYQANIPDPQNPSQTIPNPESLIEFTQRMVRKHIIEVVKTYEANRDAEAARIAAIQNVESQIVLS